MLKTYIPKKPGHWCRRSISHRLHLGRTRSIRVKFYDADPQTLGQGWQDEWVRLINDRYTLNTLNSEPSAEFNQGIRYNCLKAVDNPAEIVQRLGLTIDLIWRNRPRRCAVRTPLVPQAFLRVRPFIIGPIVVALVLVVGSLLFGFYFTPMVVEPIRKRIRGAQGTDAAGAKKIHEIRKHECSANNWPKMRPLPRQRFGPPVVRHVSIYTPGRAYDDSFSIEDATKDDEFLGECGATISETIGVR